MSHLLTVFFAMIACFGHGNPAHHPEPFVPPSEFVNTSSEIPVPNHNSLARRSVLNSYSEDACLSCQLTENSLSATSKPQFVLRAQR